MRFVNFRGHAVCRGDPVLHELSLAPLLPDAAAFELGFFDRILGAQHALSGLGKHDVDDPFLIDLVDGGVGIARVADVGGPTQHVFQDFVLVRWFSLAVVGEQLLQVRHGALKAGEVIEFTVTTPGKKCT